MQLFAPFALASAAKLLVLLTVQDSFAARPDLHQAARSVERESEHRFSLLVLLRTGGKWSAQRLESIRSTWARDLGEGALVLLEEDEACKSEYGDNHQKGLTCLEAKSHLRFMNRTDFDWLLVVDDDTYVFADRLRDTLRQIDPTRVAAYGVPHCGDCGQGRKGFCGGGGYVLSRQSLLMMASATSAPVSANLGGAFVRHMIGDPDSRQVSWCDVRFGCVAQDQGLELVSVLGMYGTNISELPRKLGAELDEAEEAKVVELSSQEPPLVFHMVRSDEHMQRLHRESLVEKDAHSGRPTWYGANGTSGQRSWWARW